MLMALVDVVDAIEFEGEETELVFEEAADPKARN